MKTSTLARCQVPGQIEFPLDFVADPSPTLTTCDCTPAVPRPCGHCKHCDTCGDCNQCAGPGCTCPCEEVDA